MTNCSVLLLDEPSMGLSPLLMYDMFRTLKKLNQQGMTILLVEQNARAALGIADVGFIMENGRIVLDGTAAELLGNPDVQEFYLGLSHGGEKRRYRDVKHYRRRKRWLS